jgi:hypothetical protein
MHLAENFMVDALLVSGRMALPTILYWHVAFIFVMSLTFLGVWEALPCAEWSDAFLSCRLETGLWFSYSGHPGSIM